MSAEIEEQPSVVRPDDPVIESSKKPERSYTREFLLSLSELEVCKHLPDGFDKSLLSEFEESSHGIQDRPRVPGSSSLHGFRRTEYGSSPPTRGDSGSYSRGLHRWDSRSSGRSDTDSESESGRRYGGQMRRSGQNPEHDGLLGSGSFPRPSGFATGASVPRFRPNGNVHLNRSSEPYHPPRPYKAGPHSRRETNDSFNDETFGSTDSTSEDRAEEEKKRRAEFELMRKEQQKALQEKQKSNSGKLEDPFSDMTGLLENPGDRKVSSDSDKILKQPTQNDSGKLPVPRPLVPPGFVNSVDKNSATKPLVHGDQLEVGKSGQEESLQDMKSMAKERTSSELQCETTTPAFKSEKVPDLSAVLQAPDQTKTSRLPDASKVHENGEVIELGSDITEHKLLGEPGRSTSILDKLFGNAITASSGSTSDLVEDHDTRAEDIWSPNTLQSKFARWFLEEDKKPVEDVTAEKPNDLLSLIVGGEKAGPSMSDPDITVKGPKLSPETMLGHMTLKSASSTAEASEQLYNSNAPEVKPMVLTCEDLEQSILSGIGGSCSNSQPAGQESRALDVKAGDPSASTDNQASQHLLSLLQRGKEAKNVTSISVVEGSLEKPFHQEVGKIDAADSNRSSGDVEGLDNSSKTLTLEALFGTAFMKELHSAQRNSAGSASAIVSEPPGLPFLTSDSALFPSTINEFGNGMGNRDSNTLLSNDGVSKMDKAGHRLNFHDPGRELEFSKPPAEIDSKFGCFDGGMEVRLPEEDSLINLGDPINANSSILLRGSSSSNSDMLSSSSTAPVNIMEKLAVLGATLKDERSMIGAQDPMLLRGPFDIVKPELPYQNLQAEASSSQLHPQMNHGKPMFHPLESHPAHVDPQLKFMPPEAMIHRDGPMHHQFPANMSHPPMTHHSGLPGFDHPIPPPILQQMHMAGNLPPPQLSRGFPGGAPMPPHPTHNPAGFIQEHNPMPGFPFGQRQPNFGGPGMTPPGPEMSGANNPPEAFQRLLEMELRANPKQMHPFAGPGHSRPMYGHELDMGFRYR